jgi:hypothetical protein
MEAAELTDFVDQSRSLKLIRDRPVSQMSLAAAQGPRGSSGRGSRSEIEVREKTKGGDCQGPRAT